LKAKQLGITWLMQGANLHLASFKEGANVITLSKGQEEAAEELDYSRFMHNQLPNWLQCRVDLDQRSLISFPDMYSKMRALPSTESSGVGFGGATRIVLDEFEYHPYAEMNYSEIKPMIDAGGQLVILSTADKTRSKTKFKEIYKKARLGENNFFPIFLPYNLIDYRTEDWYKAQQKDMAPWECESKYPRTEDEALSVIGVMNFFVMEILKQMLAACTLQPVETRYNGMVKIYKPPYVGGLYISGIDISDGKYDFTAMPVMDARTKEVVATFHAQIQAERTAYIINELGREYNNALLAPERNNVGLPVVNKLVELEYPNLYYGNKEKNQVGWYTTGQKSGIASAPSSRGTILHALRVPLANRQIVIYNPDIIRELMDFIQPQDDTPQPARGSHDDWVMAMAITWQLIGQVRPEFTGKPRAYKGI